MIDRAKQLLASVNRWLDRYRVTRIGRRSVLDFLNHEALTNAGSMAYFAMLSVFQVLVLAVVVLSLFLGSGGARTFVIDQVTANSPIDPSTVTAMIDAVIASRGGISVISAILLLWSALGAFSALNRGIAHAFVAAEPRPFWRDKLVGLGVMGVAGSLAVSSIVIGFLADAVRSMAGDAVGSVPGAGLALDAFSLLIPILVIFGVFLAVYRITPNRPVTLHEVWPGAVIATILWTLLRIGFTYYATHIAKYNSAFGPISTAVSLLVFLYFASVVVLLGAEVARANVLEEERERRERRERLRAEARAAAEEEEAHATTEPLPGWAKAIGGMVAGAIVRRVARRDRRP